MYINGPIKEFIALCRELLSVCNRVQVIGSFSMVEFIPKDKWGEIETNDIDFQLSFSAEDEVKSIGKIMSNNGYKLVGTRDGKWISISNPTLEVDLVVGHNSPFCTNSYCFSEPFANVAYICSEISTVISSSIPLLKGILYTSNWLSCILGKAHKVIRFMNRSDWDVNEYRIKEGQKACHDIYLILSSVAVQQENFLNQSFIMKFEECRSAIEEPLTQAVVALETLFGECEGYGHELASRWSIANLRIKEEIIIKVVAIVFEIKQMMAR